MQDDHLVDTLPQEQKLNAMSLAEQENLLRQMRDEVTHKMMLDRKVAQGVPRAIRRQAFKSYKPKSDGTMTRREKKALARANRLGHRDGIL